MKQKLYDKVNSQIGMIGLEIHVYPVTKEKLFCRCRAVRGKGEKANILSANGAYI